MTELFCLPTELEWTENVFDESHTATILFGELSVEPFTQTRWRIVLYAGNGNPGRRVFIEVIEDDIDTLDEAKASALQWYRARLASAFVHATDEQIEEAIRSIRLEQLERDSELRDAARELDERIQRAIKAARED